MHHNHKKSKDIVHQKGRQRNDLTSHKCQKWIFNVLGRLVIIVSSSHRHHKEEAIRLFGRYMELKILEVQRTYYRHAMKILRTHPTLRAAV